MSEFDLIRFLFSENIGMTPITFIQMSICLTGIGMIVEKLLDMKRLEKERKDD